jgi:hypothetical protein
VAKRKRKGTAAEGEGTPAADANGAQTPDTVEDMFEEWKKLRGFRTRVRERLVSYKQKASNGPRELRRFLNDLDRMTA